MSELRITDTNSANDSKGRAFGLEGNDFIYPVIGIVVAIGSYLLLSLGLGVGKAVALLLSLPFVVVPALWIGVLKHNRPEGYAEDWFENIVNREGWSALSTSKSADELIRMRGK